MRLNELRRIGVLLLFAPMCLLAQDIPVNTESAGARANFVLGLRAYDANRWDDARAHFDRAIEKDPEFAAALYYRAINATSGADWKAHMERAQASKDSASPFVQLLIAREMAYVNGDTKTAHGYGSDLVAQYPTLARAYLLRAEDYAKQKMYAEQRGALRTAMKLDPDFAPAYIWLADSYIFNEPKKFEKAEKYARKLIALSPEEPYSYILLGDAARAQNSLERARDAYAAAIDIDPTNVVTHSKKGHAESFLGNMKAAREDYEAAAKVTTAFAGKINQRNFAVYTYLYDNDVDKALKANAAVLKSIESADLPAEETAFSAWNTYWQRGQIAMYHGKFDMAETAFAEQSKLTEQLIEQVDEDGWAQTQRANDVLSSGMLAAHRGDLDKARTLAARHYDMLKGQTDDRRYEKYHHLMAVIEGKAGNHQAALEHFAKANDQNPMVKLEMADAYAASGHDDKARKLYKEVAEFNFNGIMAALTRNQAMSKMGTSQANRGG